MAAAPARNSSTLTCSQFISNVSNFLDDLNTISGSRNFSDDGSWGHATAANAIEKIIIPAVCVFGILGNVLNLVVLTRKQLKSTMDDMEKSSHLGLVALAVSDFIFCLLSITIHFIIPNKFIFTQKDSIVLFYYFVYYEAVNNIAMLASTWLTVVMALGRYIGICHPLHARGFINLNGTRAAIAIVCMGAVLANLPKFWHYYPKISPCSDLGQQIQALAPAGGVSCDCHYYSKARGDLYGDKTFVWIFRLVYFILSLILPLIILSVCNVCLIRALRQSYKMQRQYRANAPRDSGHRITPTLISLIILFTILVTPSEVIAFFKDDFPSYPLYMTMITSANLLLSINYSINFVLYCVINVQFRKTIKSIVSCAVRGRVSSPEYTKANQCTTLTVNVSECETEM
ncbi:hypothetical protein CAPTEDRAFT_208770 [Capitella teleta]|uniref:G-protein coupled receptors family 1 profile domain-containing protein n=1 Tax=Capitella teleta TaxID=283909 RepID=R7TQD3_CAPTE|nr:hypothetical protein CAPTEDRAFT_208770 [Capitella teleta]|eukprot:ELT96128.1 hypothetical protein CAPTEDRAFT_208770 [Capitella teleta]